MSAPWVDPLTVDELAEEAAREASEERMNLELWEPSVDLVLVARYEAGIRARLEEVS